VNFADGIYLIFATPVFLGRPRPRFLGCAGASGEGDWQRPKFFAKFSTSSRRKSRRPPNKKVRNGNLFKHIQFLIVFSEIASILAQSATDTKSDFSLSM